MIPDLNINDYNYDLPDDRIAHHPLDERDMSKLLVSKGDEIIDSNFNNLVSFIPNRSLLVFNNTKVIPARLKFKKETGAEIEIFCLEPVTEVQQLNTNECVWKCMVGNSKKWKQGSLKIEFTHKGKQGILSAEKLEPVDNTYHIKFVKDREDMTFFEVLEVVGSTPLPPYMQRKATKSDREKYQTIYAKHDGSVAAPTAGLHFTEDVFKTLDENKITRDNVTLHVGAGTFVPVKADDVSEHVMHSEKISINYFTIENILKTKDDNKVIAVGTTTIRTLESLYWFGTELLKNKNANFFVSQWQPYEKKEEISLKDSFSCILNYMKENNLETISGFTQIIIAPGYKFKVIDGMITNFHQPKSTLLLLISAFLGNKWKDIYNHALEDDYRFLSYGDSCLFL